MCLWCYRPECPSPVLRRDGQPENALREVVRCCQRLLPERGGVRPTQLFSKNAEVDRVNTAELAGLAHPQACSRQTNPVAEAFHSDWVPRLFWSAATPKSAQQLVRHFQKHAYCIA